MVNSDDPSMFHTRHRDRVREDGERRAVGVETVRELSLNGVDGSWLSDDDKRRMRQEFTEQIDELEAELATAGSATQ